MKKTYTQEEIVNHLKATGFFYQNAEIYGGLANSWDYGPLGVLLKKHLKDLWWDFFITKRDNIIALDSSILSSPSVWKASGHLDNFSDPLIDCKKCKNRFRVDKLINEFDPKLNVNENYSFKELEKIIKKKKINCPSCKNFDWTSIKNFNLMFETRMGTTVENKNLVYLRPETAQGIFINFKNIQRTSRMKLPFGVAQIGKAFRNEITPSNFIYRSREFEQMEIEYFTSNDNEEEAFDYFLNEMTFFIKQIIGINHKKIKLHKYPKDEIAHYAKKTIDIFFDFPHGWSELCGISNRTNFDLKNHSESSKKDLTYQDENHPKFFPSVIEPTMGVDRLVYAILINGYEVEDLKDDSRVVLKIKPQLAPYRYCVLPLTNKLKKEAHKLYMDLKKLNISCTYDEAGSIGKRYRRQDAIGTYECLTFDFDSINDQMITIRNRDTMNQIRMSYDEFLKNIRVNNDI
ncbi:MAG: glycine--tRNA ligase [Mycoplasmoidaceae bacterium]